MYGTKVMIVVICAFVQVSCLAMEPTEVKKWSHYRFISPTNKTVKPFEFLGCIGTIPVYGTQKSFTKALPMSLPVFNRIDTLQHGSASLSNLIKDQSIQHVRVLLKYLEAENKIDEITKLFTGNLEPSTICQMLPELMHGATVKGAGTRVLSLEEQFAMAQVYWMAGYVATLYDAKSKRKREYAQAKLQALKKQNGYWWHNVLKHKYFTPPGALQILHSLSSAQVDSVGKYIW